MKRLLAFLVIAGVLGAVGFFALGRFIEKPQMTSAQAPEPRMAPQSAVTVQAKSQAFDEANIAFQTPTRMRLGKSKDVTLVLNLKKTIDELREQLGKEFPTQGATVEASPIMEASLSGGSFTITAANPVQQAIRPDDDTTWEWSVVPREQGQHTLKLRLYAIVTLQGTAAPMEIKTFERDIPVDVSIPELLLSFVKNNIQLVWLVLVVPIAGFLSRLFKAKDKEADTA